ncbi:porin family protein [Maribellus maritimus]|uniref:porin family protein n=1 Tax=Maribellus maritimus TaxID=2870838 RepID=UPI001EEB62C2|nr:porin family protein [Maribellus maritimus]MCG6191184.1 PorT family protein [Maribellus maritimus]
MKTKLIVTLIFLCCTGILKAQNRLAGVGGLIKIGTDISFFSSGLGVQHIPVTGFHIGLAPSFQLSPSVYFKPEVAFSMKGGRMNYDSGFGYFDGDVRYRINYFEFPMMLGIKPKPRFSIEIGPYVAIEAGGNFDFEGDFAYGYGRFYREDIHDFDYGIAAGVKIGPLEIRYYHGLQEIAGSDISRAFLGNTTNHSVQICFQRSRFKKF